MAIYVYSTANGSLYSWCPGDTDPVADQATLAAEGRAAVKGLPQLDATHNWDPASKTVITVAAALGPKPIATGAWILRFTPAEFTSIQGSNDPQVAQWLYALNHTTQIDLADPAITQGLDYLVSISVLQIARVATLLS